MAFTLAQARYDRKTKRAYVELRDADDDGGEMLATAIFSFRTKGSLSNRETGCADKGTTCVQKSHQRAR